MRSEGLSTDLISRKFEQQIDYQAAAEQLRAAISDYLNIDTLTPIILNKLTEKIQVGHAEHAKKVDGQMYPEGCRLSGI